MIRPGNKVVVHGEVEQVIFGKEIKVFVIRAIPCMNKENPGEVFTVLEGAVESEKNSVSNVQEKTEPMPDDWKENR